MVRPIAEGMARGRDPGKGQGSSRMRKALLSVLIVLVIYWDVATITDQADLPVVLPVNETLGRYNRMFAVFKHWSPDVFGWVMRVKWRERRPGARPRWSEERVHDLFPMTHGESFTRILTYALDDPAELTRQLFVLYQRRHPERVVLRLELYHAKWPASPEGLVARYDERELEMIAAY